MLKGKCMEYSKHLALFLKEIKLQKENLKDTKSYSRYIKGIVNVSRNES